MAKEIDPVAAYKYGFEVFKANAPVLVPPAAVLVVAPFILFLIGSKAGILGLVFDLMAFVVATYLICGLLQLCLNLHDRKEVDVKDAFQPHPQFTNMLAASFIIGVLVSIGTCLLLLPGIYAAIVLVFGPLLVLEKGRDPIAALKESRERTKGKEIKLLIFLVIAAVAGAMGTITLGLGLIVTTPVTLLALVSIYRQVVRR